MAQINELTEHSTNAEAEAAAKAYSAAWPRCGYGTSVMVYAANTAHPEGPWKLSTSRDSSCD